MNLGDLRTSKFLKKEDVGEEALVTITAITRENVAMEGAEAEYRAAAHFQELEKPMILNSTNGQIIARIAGTEDDIEVAWRGVQVVLYNDPNVSFGGRLVGGIRVRAPKKGAAAPAPVAPPVVDPDSDLPF